MGGGRNRAMPVGIIYSINPVMERSDLAGMRAVAVAGAGRSWSAATWPWWRQGGRDAAGWPGCGRVAVVAAGWPGCGRVAVVAAGRGSDRGGADYQRIMGGWVGILKKCVKKFGRLDKNA